MGCRAGMGFSKGIRQAVKSHRWLLSLAYLFATLMAQGPHDHGHRADDATVSRGDCDALGVHVAGHEHQQAHETPDACPACHFRAEHPLWQLAPRPLPGPSVAIPAEAAHPSTRLGSPLRTRCRAPPRD
jgi:hypothetical protein